MSVKEIKVCIPEEQYSLTQSKLSQYRLNKRRINFLLERINSQKHAKECEKRSLDTLEQDRNKIQEQIDNYTKEINLLHDKKQTRKIGIRIQSLDGIRGRLYDELRYNLTKARFYRILKGINCTLIQYIHEYRKKLEQNQVISQKVKEIVVNNVNWCEIIE